MDYYNLPLPPLTKAIACDEFALQERILILNERMVSNEYERKQRLIDEFREEFNARSNGRRSHY